ncbi:ABC transporter ATP-binding protein [Eggerthellaceae bacterium PR-HUZ602407-17]
MIECRELAKSFDDQLVFSHLNMRIEEGERICLMAPSGSGKTTLLRILLGLESYDSGTLINPHTSSMAVVFQEDRLCDALSAVDNVALVCKPGVSRRSLRAMLCEVLPNEVLDKQVAYLSGGQRRRVALVRAFACDAHLLVLDEPFSGLDSETRSEVAQFMLRHQNNATLLVSTHGEHDHVSLHARVIRLNEIAQLSSIAVSQPGGAQEAATPANESAAVSNAASDVASNAVSNVASNAASTHEGVSVSDDASDNTRAAAPATASIDTLMRLISEQKSMHEIVSAEPSLGKFLVSKGLPFSLSNPITECVTFDDAMALHDFDKDAFLREYRQYKCQIEA